MLRLISHKRSTSVFSGNQHSKHIGTGVEFTNLREYNTNDNARLIDWKMSAKSDRVYSREYEESTELKVFLIIEISPSMYFGTNKTTKIHTLIETIETILRSCDQYNHILGWIIWDQNWLNYISPKWGKYNRYLFSQILEKSLKHPPKISKTSTKEIIEMLIERKITNQLILYITDNTSIQEIKKITNLSYMNDFIYINIFDTMESNISKEFIKSPIRISTNITSNDIGSLAINYQNLRNLSLQKLEHTIKIIGASYLTIFTHQKPSIILENFFLRRKKH